LRIINFIYILYLFFIYKNNNLSINWIKDTELEGVSEGNTSLKARTKNIRASSTTLTQNLIRHRRSFRFGSASLYQAAPV